MRGCSTRSGLPRVAMEPHSARIRKELAEPRHLNIDETHFR